MPLEYTLVERIVFSITSAFTIILGIFKIIEFFELRSRIKIEPYSYGLGVRKRTEQDLGVAIRLHNVKDLIKIPENILWFKLEFRLVNSTDKKIVIKNIYCLWEYPKFNKLNPPESFYFLGKKVISLPLALTSEDRHIVIEPNETKIIKKYYEVSPFIAYCLDIYKDKEKEMVVNGGKIFLPNRIKLELVLVDTKGRKTKENFEFFNW